MTINLSEADLGRIFPHANDAIMSSVAAEWNDTLGMYGINATEHRLAFFMAQTSAETGGWRGMVEGGEFSGERDLYKGRGLIQLTGRSNYLAIGEKLAQDFPNSGLVFDIASNPQLVSQPKYVLKTAAAYWDLNKLNAISDTGDFLHLSNKINGSKTVPNGWSLRQSELARIERLLTSIAESSAQPTSSPTVLQLGDSGQMVGALQMMLRNAGYDVGGVDGKFGTLTRMALMAFQADHSLVPTGVADSGTNIALNNPGQRPLDDQRVSATINDLINNGSRTAVNGRRINWLGLLAIDSRRYGHRQLRGCWSGQQWNCQRREGDAARADSQSNGHNRPHSPATPKYPEFAPSNRHKSGRSQVPATGRSLTL